MWPAAGIYLERVDVALACGTPGAHIHYTTDGSPPGPDAAVASGPVRIEGVGPTLVRARAVREGMWESEEAAQTYTVIMQAGRWRRIRDDGLLVIAAYER